jgi:hypothetical protein
VLRVVTKTEARGAIQNPRRPFFIFCKEFEKNIFENFRDFFQKFSKSANFKTVEFRFIQIEKRGAKMLHTVNYTKIIFIFFKSQIKSAAAI